MHPLLAPLERSRRHVGRLYLPRPDHDEAQGDAVGVADVQVPAELHAMTRRDMLTASLTGLAIALSIVALVVNIVR